MKICHVPFTYHPDPVGGTEVYVEGLIGALAAHRITAVVAAPGETGAQYTHAGVAVRRFAGAGAVRELGELYGEGQAASAEGFGRILDEERPDLVHLHAISPAVSLRLVRESHRRQTPVLLTYHTPTVSCPRGTLLQWGRQACEGRLLVDLCTRCTLQGLGVPRLFAEVVGRTPVAVGRLLGAARARGGGWTALRMRQLIATRHTATHALFEELDRIIAVCAWSRDLLLANGVPDTKITLCRQGLAAPEASAGGPAAAARRDGPLRLVSLGRADPTKGFHLVIEALRRRPTLEVTWDCYGTGRGPSPTAYQRHLRTLAGEDARLRFHDPCPSAEVIGRLASYDLVVVPSQILETGPQVVLEAFAAGRPVLGSRLGGIAELVEDEVNGLLVEAGSPAAWHRAVQRVARDPGLLPRLQAGVRRPRPMAAVADEMAALYHPLVAAAR